MKIALGADECGYQLKEAIKEFLLEKTIAVDDVGTHNIKDEIPYYQIAENVANKVANKSVDRGILCCGTGMGMAIIANKYPGVYAAVCESTYAAQQSRSINNSNVLTLGGFITTPTLAREIVNIWLTTEFTQGWEKKAQEWLRNSMKDIAELENKSFHRNSTSNKK